MVHFYIPVYTTSHILMLRKDYTSPRSDSASQNFLYTDGLDYFNTFNTLKRAEAKEELASKRRRGEHNRDASVLQKGNKAKNKAKGR